MSLATTYAETKKKTAEKPWYTRWVWWLVAAGLGLLVFTLWYFAKQQEARQKAALAVAEEKVKRARIEALAEQDRERAAQLLGQATVADIQAKNLRRQIEKSSETRKQLEAAIKGATSWEELEELEKEIK